MNYHPDSLWLEQYAAGTLPMAYSLCVAVHLSYCRQCRAEVEALQGLGGALMQQLPPVAVGDDLFQRVLSRLEDTPEPAAAAVPDRQSSCGVPAPLRQFVPGGYDQLRWSWLLPSVRASTIDLGEPGYQVALHRIEPGGRVMTHDHRDEELTLVLNGSFSDEFDIYRDGDFLVRGPSERHQPTASRNEPCLCLTVQRAPVRFTGPVARLLNPFLR